MGWIKSLFGREKPIDPLALGHQTAETIAKGLDDYLAARMPKVTEDYLDVFRKQIAAAIVQTDPSPMVTVQENMQGFLHEIELLQEQITTGALSFLIPSKEMFGHGELLDELAKAKAAEAAGKVKSAGLDLLRNAYPELETADDRWRARAP